MVTVKWEPFRDLMAMQDRMTRLFDETLSRVWKEEPFGRFWKPLVDIFERDNEVILKIDLPEMDQNEIDIRIEENTLIVQGERKFIKEFPECKTLQIERIYGPFQRTFAIPRVIDQGKIKASYKDGVLRLVLPKKEEILTKQILVQEI